MKAEPQRMISSSSPFRRPHEIKGCKSLLLIVAVLSLVASSLVLSVHGLGFALVTGATGQTGRIVTQLLLDQGYDIRVFVRDIDRARNTLKELTNDDSTCTIEYCQGELNDMSSIAQAFECTSSKPLTHVVYCAGGDGVDYYHVSYKAVAECAKLACQENSQVENFVFISTAWYVTRFLAAGVARSYSEDSPSSRCHTYSPLLPPSSYSGLHAPILLHHCYSIQCTILFPWRCIIWVNKRYARRQQPRQWQPRMEKERKV